jgi:THO complex subunit 2
MNDNIAAGSFAQSLARALELCDTHGVEIALSTAIDSLCSSEAGTSKSIIDCIAAACSDSTRHMLDDAIVDTCWSLDTLYCTAGSESKRKALHTFIKDCLTRAIVSEHLLRVRMELSTAESLQLLPSAEKIIRKTSLYTTKINLQQNKFNLLREESEGFSKVAVEILEGAALCTANVSTLSDNIKSAIASFNLDPNRVLDLMLDALESNLQTPSGNDDAVAALMQLISRFKTPHLAQLIGFKLVSSSKSGTAEVPMSLMRAAARLVSYGHVTLDALWPHMAPSEAAVASAWKEHCDSCVAAATQFVVRSFNNTESENKMKEILKALSYPRLPRSAQLSAANQKVMLCAALIELGSIEEARAVTSTIGGIDIGSCESVAVALYESMLPVAKQLHELIVPLSNGSTSSAMDSDSDASVPQRISLTLKSFIFPRLRLYGVHIGNDPLLFCLVCRLFAAAAVALDFSDLDTKECVCILVASTALQSTQPFAALPLWQLLEQIPVSVRWDLYAHVKFSMYYSVPALVVARAFIGAKAQRELKTSTVDNKWQIGRLLLAMTSSQPLIVFDTIINDVMRKGNGALVSKIIRASPAYALDCLLYTIMEELGMPEDIRSRIAEDKVNVAAWFQNISEFIGQVTRLFSVDLLPVLMWILVNLNDEKPLEVIILRHVITQCSGLEYSLDGMKRELCEARCCLPKLRSRIHDPIEESTSDELKEKKNASRRLTKALQQNDLSASIAIALAHAVSVIELTAGYGSTDVYHLVWAHDTIMQVLIVYMDFIRKNLLQQYAASLPLLSDLVNVYNIELSLAMFISAPCYHLENNAAGYHTYSIAQQIPLIIPSQTREAFDTITPDFYAAFWSLNISDIYVNKKLYAAEIAKITDKLSANQSGHSISELRSLRPKLQDSRKDLESELIAATSLVAHHKEKLQSMSRTLAIADIQSNRVAVGFVEACLFPRMFLSIEDSVFCSRFLILLSELKFERVSLIQITDKVIQKVGTVAMSCTPIERICLSRFISEMLQYFKGVSSVKDFASVADTPAFERIVRGKEGAIVPQAITQTKFVAFLYGLHKTLLSEIKECLMADEAYHSQSGLMLLSHLIKMEAFPAYRQHATDLSAAIERKVAALDETHDGVRLVARSLLSPLSALSSLPDASVHDSSFASVAASAPATAAEIKRKNAPIASIVTDGAAVPLSKPPPPSTPHPSEIKKAAGAAPPTEKASGSADQSKLSGPPSSSSSSAAASAKDKSPPRFDPKFEKSAAKASFDVNSVATANKGDDERSLKEQKDLVMRSKQANSKAGDSQAQSSAVEIGSKRGHDESSKIEKPSPALRPDASGKAVPAAPSSTASTVKPSSRDEPRRDSTRDAGQRVGVDTGAREGGSRDGGVSARDSVGRDLRIHTTGGPSAGDTRDRSVVVDRYFLNVSTLFTRTFESLRLPSVSHACAAAALPVRNCLHRTCLLVTEQWPRRAEVTQALA